MAGDRTGRGEEGTREAPGFASKLLRIALVAAAVRMVSVLFFSPPTSGIYDAFYFQQVARFLAAGHGFVNPWQAAFADTMVPSAEHPPLYPLLLALVVKLGIVADAAQRGVGAFLGAATVFTIGLLARKVAGARVGLFAAALAALYPQLVGADSALLSETLYGLLVASVLLVAGRAVVRPSLSRWLTLGVLAALAALTRSEALLLAVLVGFPVVLARPARRGRCLAAIAGAMLIVLGPWLARNWAVFGRPLLSNNYGSVLVQANCEAAYYGPVIGGIAASCLSERAAADEAEVARRWALEGMSYAREHIGRAALVAVARVLRTWSLYRPLQSVSDLELEGRAAVTRYGGLIGFYVLLPLAIAGAISLRRSPLLPVLLAPMVLVVAVSALGAGWVRFRHAAEIPLLVLAAVPLERRLRSSSPQYITHLSASRRLDFAGAATSRASSGRALRAPGRCSMDD